MSMQEFLDKSEDFNDIFELVKKCTERSLGERRAGLMLYLAPLDRRIGAFHTLGTNGIVMNKKTLDAVIRAARSRREINAYVFSILLHEYLHALGHVNERDVRRLVYRVSAENLGANHPATDMALNGPQAYFPGIVEPEPLSTPVPESEDISIVKEFDKSSSQSYIS